MRKVVIAALVAIALVACGPGAPKAGRVVEKRYEPFREWDTTYQVEHCFSYDKNGWCESHYYTWQTDHHEDDEDWMVKLEECHYDNSGDQKCRTGWREIAQSDWESLKEGDLYGERTQ